MQSAVGFVVLISLVCASLFGAPAYIFSGFDAVTGLASASFGALLGALAAPEIAPAKFRHPALLQMSVAIAAGCLVAWIFRAPWEGYALAALIGAIIGYLAPYWIKHVK